MFSKNKKINVYIIFAGKSLIGIGLVVYVFKKNQVSWADLFHEKTIVLLAILLALQIVIFLLSTLRWVLITRGMTNADMTLRQGLLICWIGQFFSSFLPELISSDVTRFYYASKIYPGIKNNVKTIVCDRVVALTSLFLLILISLSAYHFQWDTLIYLSVTLLSFCALTFGLKAINTKFRVPPAAFWISLATFSFKAFSLFAVFLIIQPEQANAMIYHLSMAGQALEILPLTPANLGIGHYAYDLIFNLQTGINGAVIYNYYFISKMIFKLSGALAWSFYRMN